MNNEYFNTDVIRKEFKFLLDMGFRIIESSDRNSGSSVEYSNDKIRVRLTFDYKDYFYYFKLIRGKDTQYPNDSDNLNIRTFWDLALKVDKNFNLDKLIPNKEKNNIDVLKENAELLRSYGGNILNGKEWL